MTLPHLSVAIPAMDELDTLPLTLDDLRRQRYRDFSVYVCVNQPEPPDGIRTPAALRNKALLEILRERYPDVRVIDRSSPGSGMGPREQGVGWARKCLFDMINTAVGDDEVVVSLDADTRITDDYLLRLAQTFAQHPAAGAIAVPYYHLLTGNEGADRSLLRYECYMRHYLIEMLRIESPYAFTAIGSAMAFTAKAYRRVGGITPLAAGEDFYLMQKFAKTGVVLRWLDGGEATTARQQVALFPSGRISQRVPFGTGPAVSLSVDEQAERYPFFAPDLFAEVAATYALFPVLYEHDVETPMSSFLLRQLRTDDLWGSLRKNFKRRELFVHACHERVDGLRILQYLRSRTEGGTRIPIMPDYARAPLDELDAFRNGLLDEEMTLRRKNTPD